MPKKVRSKQTLVDKILGDGKVIDNLKKNDTEISLRLSHMEPEATKLKTMILDSRAQLFFFNGRITPLEYEFSEKVLDKAEGDLLELLASIRDLKKVHKEVLALLDSIEKSQNSEVRVLALEKYLSPKSSTLVAKSNVGMSDDLSFASTLKKIAKEAKLLSHSVTALLELKASKSS